jgi:hypothetical protein
LDRHRMIGCTQEGSMYFFENNELKKEYENAFNSEEPNSRVVFILRGFEHWRACDVGSQRGKQSDIR